ncbi:MAG: hypothetical protein EOP13_22675 [Pseudomonas sp.]|uniref:hypothetical protein n=1 Tax=Pseudomonas sp. TaxID=306 RepID=UPI001227A1ED|nr:hypothetical protein [Pseudomonas sp.]RZI69932.1 MAG: hypothetical protein EOP13_22675 [Pseudomonas sp.]
MKKRSTRLSLIERALIERDWHQTAIVAQIHALCGNNSQGMVEAAGRVLFVVLAAVVADDHQLDSDDLNLIHQTLIAMHDQVDDPEISSTRRACIICGLQAAERIIPLLQRCSLVSAACKLKEKLKKSHILLEDFNDLIDFDQRRPINQDQLQFF